MSKELEYVEELKLKYQENGAIRRLNAIEKSLKVLEIVKEKGLSLLHKSLIISSKNYEEYRQEFQLVNSKLFRYEYFYSQEEYDLLKEVLL